jgi:hypothetical protein
MEQYFTRKNIITAFSLIAIGIIGRMLLEAYPNVETLTLVTLLAGALLGPYLGFAVGLLSVIGSDVLIGNELILIYTWSAWAVIGVGSSLLKKRTQPLQVWSDSLKFTLGGVVSTLFFYLWTNFGVWHIGNMYPHTVNGLVESYVMALPFLRYQLVSNLIIVPVGSVIILTILKYAPVMYKRYFKPVETHSNASVQ